MNTILAEYLSSVPITYTRQPTLASNYSSRGYNAFLWLPQVPALICVYMYTDIKLKK